MPRPDLRTPDSFEHSQLAIADFDGTAAQTFEQSPAGIDVRIAYEAAVEFVFGQDGLEKYEEAGGLQNRAPIEVVQSLAPEASSDQVKQLTEQLVRVKLDVLLAEVGTHFSEGGTWPRSMPGYLEFLKELEAARENGQPIDDLILSSGHMPFIEKTFDSWEATLPDHIIAEETLKELKLGHIYKPSPVLMDLAEGLWRQNYGLNRKIPVGTNDRSRIKYIGDSEIMDGGLAFNSGVDFSLISQKNSAEAWKKFGKSLDLGRIGLNESHHDK
ncbi:MAG: hypothetical protein JWN26_749 [Candidatus Saccharibacteria bacterium]|nr:hypothetical protein [Candidatus Saccharibacteria bacterium]